MGLIEKQVAAELAEWPGFRSRGLGAEKICENLVRPPKDDMGDLAFATFKPAKEAGKPPAQLALELVAGRDTASISKRLRKVEDDAPDVPSPRAALVVAVGTAGPYVNIRLNRAAVSALLLKEIEKQGQAYGNSKAGKGRTLVVDLSSPNIAKPLAVHHLRSTMIGYSIKKIRESQGWRVVGVNHLGDWGTGFGKLIAGLKKYFPEVEQRAKAGDEQPLGNMSVQTLNETYSRFNNESKGDDDLADAGRSEFALLEQHIEALVKGEQTAAGAVNFRIWQHTREISLAEFERMYAHLGLSFHLWPVVDLQLKKVLTEESETFYRQHCLYVGESYYVTAEDLCRRIIVDAVENKVAEESEGAIVIYTHGKDKPPLMLVKNDGATSYHVRDLAAAIYRHRHWQASELTYVVGGEQKWHFEQLFKALDMLGHQWARGCSHTEFGLMLFQQADGKWAKTSTRRGTAIMLEDLLDEAIKSVREIMAAKNPELASTPEGEAVAHAVGVGAVVFNDLKAGRRNNVKFDWDAVLDFEGESGPYMLYQYVRMGSVTEKYREAYGEPDFAAGDAARLNLDEEWRILKLLADFPDAVAKASDEYEPSVVAQHLIKLASATSTWWVATRDSRIVGDDRDLSLARVRLVNAIRTTLGKGLTLLGMSPVDRM
ncbi:MAG: arginine--tRNA ligase [Planctomycetes bacterium]|nr:arginine--tRNA ligase [Planctomycetota bacterium]